MLADELLDAAGPKNPPQRPKFVERKHQVRVRPHAQLPLHALSWTAAYSHERAFTLAVFDNISRTILIGLRILYQKAPKKHLWRFFLGCFGN